MPDLTTDELVVLVDDSGRPVGTAAKAAVHTGTTPLHRAFSCYLFDAAGRVLVTRRADAKATFPGMWTNSVCGHPGPGEGDDDAVARRAGSELGMTVRDLTCALPTFRYRAEHAGVVENEICPVYLARTDDVPRPDPAEVGAHQWMTWQALVGRLQDEPAAWSPWCRLQVAELGRAVEAFLTPST